MYPSEAPLAYKVDHVGVSLTDARTAFEFCHEQLHLPVAWEFKRYGGPVTGGIGLGNLNLEFLDAGTVGLPVHDPAAVGLVALQPAPRTVEALTASLSDRGISPLDAVTTGGEVFGFTNVFLPPVGVDVAFFCSYHYPGSHDNAVREAELAAVGGGRLGLRGVTELRAPLSVDDCGAVLGPPMSGRWVFDTGPDLVADSSVPRGTARMTWSVVDIESATNALGEVGALSDGALLAVPGLSGLAISLTDAPASRPAHLAAKRAADRSSD